VPPPDEMRLSFLDLVPGLLYLYRDGRLIDGADETALLALEAFLTRPKSDVTPYMRWASVAVSPEWTRIRELAMAALRNLNRPLAEKDLRGGTD